MDPVTTVDGHTYERSAITRWLRTRTTSPVGWASLQVSLPKPLAPK